MSSQKAVLKPYQLFNANSMSADATSSEVYLHGVDTAFITVDWNTSTAAGAITVEVLYDNTILFVPLNFSSAIAISGSSGAHQIKLREIPFTKIRVKYTRTSGSGVLNCWIQGKGV